MAKKRPIPAEENMTEMLFPVRGIDVSTEFELQPPQTTPTGLNVRGYEPSTMRARGGSRPGITPYVPQRVPAGAHLIQHLNYVVDPTEAALLTGFDPLDDVGGVPGTGGIPDPSTNNPSDPFGPRNPGRFVRTGGSGISLNRHAYTKGKPTGPGIAFRSNNAVRAAANSPGGLGVVKMTAQFGQSVLQGSLLLIAVGQAVGSSLSLTDDATNIWQQAGTYVTLIGSNPLTMSLWYATSTKASNPTVTITPNVSDNMYAILNEFTGALHGTTALDGIVTSQNAGFSTHFQTQTVPIAGNGRLVVGYFGADEQAPNPPGFFVPSSVFTPDSSFQRLGYPLSLVQPYANATLWGAYIILGGQSNLPVTGTVDVGTPYCAIGASFAPA